MMKLEEAMRLGALRALDAGIARQAEIIKDETLDIEYKDADKGIDWKGKRLTATGELARKTKADLETVRGDIAVMKLTP